MVVGSGDMLSTPRPGISGFGSVLHPAEQQLLSGALLPAREIIHSNNEDDSNVETIVIQQPVILNTQIVAPTQPSSVQDLVFVDPVGGDIVSFSYDPNMYPMANPVKYQRTYMLSSARRFPATYGRRRQLSFRNPAQNSYYTDDMFYDTLRSSRRSRYQSTQTRSPRRSQTTSNPRSDSWDRFLYMMFASR